MIRWILSVVLGLAACGALADFVGDFQSAQDLFDQKKWPEAAAAFDVLAGRAPAAHRDTCRVHQARALAMQKRFDEAVATADRISDAHRRAYARMCARYAAGRWTDLLAEYADEPIDAWPDDVDYLGHHMRGIAYYNAGRPGEALRDLENAAAKAGSDGWPKWEALYYAMCAAEQAGDIVRARAAADTLLADESSGRGGWPYLLCAFWKIHLLISEKRFDEAETLLATLDAGRTWGQDEYQLRYHEAMGDLALASGNTAAAKASYTKAVAVQTHASYVERLRKKLEALK
jgi:predicted negative regulator of RcsB-dependent stress response